MKAVVYLRTSTKDQHPENQLPAIEAYCRVNGHEIVGVVEEKESAYKSGRQTGLKRITKDCQDGKRPFEIVIVWALDRLSRQGIVHIVNLIEMFKLYRIRVISMQEPWLDSDGPMQELLLAVFAWAASYESKIKSERTLAGLARAKKEGVKLGRPKGRKDDNKRSRRGYLLRYAGVPKKPRPRLTPENLENSSVAL
jgi:putative DNA-invertase from lambdoid prophage Rac